LKLLVAGGETTLLSALGIISNSKAIARSVSDSLTNNSWGESVGLVALLSVVELVVDDVGGAASVGAGLALVAGTMSLAEAVGFLVALVIGVAGAEIAGLAAAGRDFVAVVVFLPVGRLS
jgi:hypothetical protein